MTGPIQEMPHPADTMAALSNQLRAIVAQAAHEDKAGTWGLDGWIRTIHNLIDLQVRTYAAVLQSGISGPCWSGSPVSRPLPSEDITVAPKDYPRDLTASDFARLGIPHAKLPAFCIGFEPEFLPAGETRFRVFLRDYRYVGANYTGKITLTSRTRQAAESETKTVIVGL
jgi:hypothetical protein